jgi:hypothetical protein
MRNRIRTALISMATVMATAVVGTMLAATPASAAAVEQQPPNPYGTNRIYYGAECYPAQPNGSISMEVTWHYSGNGFRVTRVAFWNGTNHVASFARPIRLIDRNGRWVDYYMSNVAPHSYGTKDVDFTTPDRLVRTKTLEYLASFTGFCGGSYGSELNIVG